MLLLRFDVESAYALRQEPPTEANWQKWIAESLAGVTSIVRVLERHNVPATFYITGLVLEHAGIELAALLKPNPLFDIESHSYSHPQIMGPGWEMSRGELHDELIRTSDLIFKYFGHRPIGFCAPGNYYRGLHGRTRLLAALWEEGYQFIGTDGMDARGFPFPAPMTQPYWYTEDGFPDLLEIPITGWHCNALFNSGHQNNNWQPAPAFPDGSILETLPVTVEEGFAARKREFDYAIVHGLIYAPCMHPWSVYRFDPELKHLDWLIQMAKDNHLQVLNCSQLNDSLRRQRFA
jgi:peptidoglycan/xylan/chitin deacetylase (PgdA/CDA1 family)